MEATKFEFKTIIKDLINTKRIVEFPTTIYYEMIRTKFFNKYKPKVISNYNTSSELNGVCKCFKFHKITH